MNLKTKSCLKVVKRASLVLELVELAPCCMMVSKFFFIYISFTHDSEGYA